MLFYRSIYPVNVQVDASPWPDPEQETLSFLRDYFQLDIDLVALYESWSKSDPIFNGLMPRFTGIRILRQDPWENLIS
jgi:N-glycosylase/DNA lyase